MWHINRKLEWLEQNDKTWKTEEYKWGWSHKHVWRREERKVIYLSGTSEFYRLFEYSNACTRITEDKKTVYCKIMRNCQIAKQEEKWFFLLWGIILRIRGNSKCLGRANADEMTVQYGEKSQANFNRGRKLIHLRKRNFNFKVKNLKCLSLNRGRWIDQWMQSKKKSINKC